MSKDLVEIEKIQKLMQYSSGMVECRELGHVEVKNKRLPIISFCVGTKDKTAPCLGLFGGVHGLEKIGTHVVIEFLESLFKQLKWDKDLQHILGKSRIVSIPLVNPGGMALNWRANPNGVDLMRNAPVEADKNAKGLPWLVGGHRYSNRITWFRGVEGEPMELEAQCLVDFVRREVFPSMAALSVDFHSGFGMKDRFWYPYAKTNAEFPRINEVKAIKDLLDNTLPYHIYKIEPQSSSYITHGDLWDYMFDEHYEKYKLDGKVFLPWTLEMGSWVWVKKNPKQLLSPLGLFNPIIDHRYKRTMRRHKHLIDFLFKAVRNSETWIRK